MWLLRKIQHRTFENKTILASADEQGSKEIRRRSKKIRDKLRCSANHRNIYQTGDIVIRRSSKQDTKEWKLYFNKEE